MRNKTNERNKRDMKNNNIMKRTINNNQTCTKEEGKIDVTYKEMWYGDNPLPLLTLDIQA